MAIGIDSWYLVTAKSDQLIAAVKQEVVVGELIRFATRELIHAAAGACLRASILQSQGECPRGLAGRQEQSDIGVVVSVLAEDVA